MTEPYVFVTYSREDYPFVEELANTLRAKGIPTWIDKENIEPGTDYHEAIKTALLNASAVLYVSSKKSTSSRWLNLELQPYLNRIGKPIIPIVLDNEGEKQLPSSFKNLIQIDFRNDYKNGYKNLIKILDFPISSTDIKKPELKSKGYAFISHADEDNSFVIELKSFLGKHNYSYWEYHENRRDYDKDYSIELEGIIKNAACTLSVVSKNWRDSKTSIQEFHFSKEVGTPVFILRVEDPGPTLLLSGLTFIDFTKNRKKGFADLNEALSHEDL